MGKNEIATINSNSDIEKIKKDPIRNISEVKQTIENFNLAVSIDGYALRKIPKALQTYDLCVKAIQQNGEAIKYVSKKIVDEELCRKAVENNGRAIVCISDVYVNKELWCSAVEKTPEMIQYIPKKFINKKMCKEVISKDGKLLRHIPKRYVVEELYLLALEQDGLALEFISEEIRTKEYLKLAVRSNGMALETIPSKKRSKTLSMIAIENNPMALEFVPNRFKTDELCEKLLCMDWRVFRYLPDKYFSKESVEKWLEKIINEKVIDKSMLTGRFFCATEEDKKMLAIEKIFLDLPREVQEDIAVITLMRELGARCIVHNKYYKKEGVFYVVEKLCCSREEIETVFEKFEDLNIFLNRDLSTGDFSEFDFEGINLNEYNIEGALISSEVLKEKGLYDSQYYESIFGVDGSILTESEAADNEAPLGKNIVHRKDIEISVNNEELNDNDIKLYYITDIHLMHKIRDKFPNYATEVEIKKYIEELVAQLCETAYSENWQDYLLIGGDISYDFGISKIFYSTMAKYWNREKIIVVLGNHELWNMNELGVKEEALESVINNYAKMLEELNIIFLHNQVFFLKDSEPTVISEREIIDLEEGYLKKIAILSPFLILGGLGFSGYSKDFNALNGLYRDKIKTLEEDLQETLKFEKLYTKVKKELAEHNKVIIFTHTPKENWSKDSYNPKWIYVNGHTHRNEYYDDEEKLVYADNQIGYKSRRFGLKRFNLSGKYDIFQHYSDGKYLINREEYLDFCKGQKMQVTFNRTKGDIYMCKRSNLYLFMYKENANLYLLNGGAINKLEMREIEYYYLRMEGYASAIKKMLSGYNKALKGISSEIKKIGGTGKIHGCIIDIDYFNHLYLNPFDGSITPYYALNIVDKYTYSTLDNLLKSKRPDLLSNYKNIKQKGGILIGKKKVNNILSNELAQYVADTTMYKPSRVIKTLQHLTETNIIRKWDSKIFDKLNLGNNE